MMVITDDTTRPELLEALANLNASAKRIPHIVEPAGSPHPSAWTVAHGRINAVLDDLDRVPA